MLKSINRYIIKEYISSLFVVIAVMLSIILLINLLDEFKVCHIILYNNLFN